jgi:hypothetical protein
MYHSVSIMYYNLKQVKPGEAKSEDPGLDSCKVLGLYTVYYTLSLCVCEKNKCLKMLLFNQPCHTKLRT